MSPEQLTLDFPAFIKEEDCPRAARLVSLGVEIFHLMDRLMPDALNSAVAADLPPLLERIKAVYARGLREYPGFTPRPMPKEGKRWEADIRRARQTMRIVRSDAELRYRAESRTLAAGIKQESMKLLLRKHGWSMHQLLERIRKDPDPVAAWAIDATIRFLIREGKVQAFEDFYSGKKVLAEYEPPAAR